MDKKRREKENQFMKITSFLSNLTIGNLLEMKRYKITALKHPSCPKAYYKRLQFSNGGIRVGNLAG
jgi:hypothetical protein